MERPPQNDNGQGDNESPNQEEEYQRQRRERILTHEATLQQRKEELNALICKLDQVYDDIEQKCLVAKRPRAKKVYDQLAESSIGAEYFLNPGRNMVAIVLKLWSIPAPDKPEAGTMYQNHHNLVERAAVQHANMDRQTPIYANSGTRTTSS
jgi:hypothetical protein